MRQTKIELHRLGGCKDCQQICLFNRATATKEVADQYIHRFTCNTSTWESKDLIERIPKKKESVVETTELSFNSKGKLKERESKEVRNV